MEIRTHSSIVTCSAMSLCSMPMHRLQQRYCERSDSPRSALAEGRREVAHWPTSMRQDENWTKLALAVVYGVASGVLPLHGWPCLAGFGLLSYITPFLIYNSILQLDPEEFGGHAELLNEGQMPALGAFFSRAARQKRLQPTGKTLMDTGATRHLGSRAPPSHARIHMKAGSLQYGHWGARPLLLAASWLGPQRASWPTH
ncbi:uncharacterized protein HaLaN_14712 [Haematococcus lacustris]|uniref:Uncharacterized protein n=1 Tax=Haematococcus lacustris TaxID=44745 RepID=A0A699ZQ10_HAELA|nr:uncharacterized protein HaLaN_14712 [Haematococcus lacustris]